MRKQAGGRIGKLLTLGQAATELGVPRGRVLQLSHAGLLPAVFLDKPGGPRLRFRREVVANLVGSAVLKKKVRNAHADSRAALALAQRADAKADELLRVLGFDRRSLPVAEAEVVRLFRDLRHEAKHGVTRSDEELEELGQQFTHVTEGYLKLIAFYTGETRPWRVLCEFFRLAALRYENDPIPRSIQLGALVACRQAAFLATGGPGRIMLLPRTRVLVDAAREELRFSLGEYGQRPRQSQIDLLALSEG